MDRFFADPAAMQDIGIFWVIVALSVGACVYFGPSVKAIVETLPERRRRSEQVAENCTEALHLCRAALDNNTAALRETHDDREKVAALVAEHDRKSEIRFEHQAEAITRIEGKIERKG